MSKPNNGGGSTARKKPPSKSKPKKNEVSPATKKVGKKRSSPSPGPPPPGPYDDSTQRLLESIYRDIDDRFSQHITLNPFNDHSNWYFRVERRFRMVRKSPALDPGLAIIAIAMYSPTFKSRLEDMSSEEWIQMKVVLRDAEWSLRMFAWSRGVQWDRDMIKAGVGEPGSEAMWEEEASERLRVKDQERDDARKKNEYRGDRFRGLHVHEVYLGNQRIERCVLMGKRRDGASDDDETPPPDEGDEKKKQAEPELRRFTGFKTHPENLINRGRPTGRPTPRSPRRRESPPARRDRSITRRPTPPPATASPPRAPANFRNQPPQRPRGDAQRQAQTSRNVPPPDQNDRKRKRPSSDEPPPGEPPARQQRIERDVGTTHTARTQQPTTVTQEREEGEISGNTPARGGPFFQDRNHRPAHDFRDDRDASRDNHDNTQRRRDRRDDHYDEERDRDRPWIQNERGHRDYDERNRRSGKHDRDSRRGFHEDRGRNQHGRDASHDARDGRDGPDRRDRQYGHDDRHNSTRFHDHRDRSRDRNYRDNGPPPPRQYYDNYRGQSPRHRNHERENRDERRPSRAGDHYSPPRHDRHRDDRDRRDRQSRRPDERRNDNPWPHLRGGLGDEEGDDEGDDQGNDHGEDEDDHGPAPTPEPIDVPIPVEVPKLQDNIEGGDDQGDDRDADRDDEQAVDRAEDQDDHRSVPNPEPIENPEPQHNIDDGDGQGDEQGNDEGDDQDDGRDDNGPAPTPEPIEVPPIPVEVPELQYNIEENICNPHHFGSKRSEKRYWPPLWAYPSDPQDPILDHGTTTLKRPTCGNCELPISFVSLNSTALRSKFCHCTPGDIISCLHPSTKIIRKPLVEIRQYENYPDAPTDSVNRGIRALCDIEKGARIALYLGDMIPRKFNPEWYSDPVYSMKFPGPSSYDAKRKEWIENDQATCDVSAAWNGNWTRFMNHAGHVAGSSTSLPKRRPKQEVKPRMEMKKIKGPQKKKTNKKNGKDRDEGDGDGNDGTKTPNASVEFVTEIIANKIRIVVMALRDISFGEEILVDYGAKFFAEKNRHEEGTRPFRKSKRWFERNQKLLDAYVVVVDDSDDEEND